MVEESLGIFTELGDPWSRGRALIVLGQIAQVQGRHDDARERFEQVLHIARATELDPLVLEAQYRLAALIALDTPAAALAFLDQIVAHPATESMTRERANRLRNDVLAAERGTTVIHLTATGEHVVTMSDVVTPREMGNGEKRIRFYQPTPTQSLYERGSERLSLRELEVLRLIASGKSNAEVAYVLVVAVSTVKSHTNSIFGKLEVTSRSEAILRAREMHLL